MNIETSNINRTNNSQTQNKANSSDSGIKFSDELKDLKKAQETDENQNNVSKNEKSADTKNSDKTSDTEKVDKAIDGLNSVLKELNQSEDKTSEALKYIENTADKNKKGDILINNDFNIQDNKELMPQMTPNMNFGGDGQPFSSFMNNENQQQNDRLRATASDLAEEAAILSTMSENIAIANRNQLLKENNNIENTKAVNQKSVSKNIENVVKFDSIIMNKADVEVFAQLVQNGEANLNNLAPESAKQAIHISKTLANMLAKSMENNQPLRIDFDNNISVIIKISRDGKISADFLPSSQVAEAYLRENLPLLRQKFDDNNIKYDELNQRERREHQKENNRKKGRDNE